MDSIAGGSRFKLYFLLNTMNQCSKLGNTKTSVCLGEAGCQTVKRSNEKQLDGKLLDHW